MIRLTINGEERDIEPPETVSRLLGVYNLNPVLVVVERNGRIVPRKGYGDEPVEEGDKLELVQMMAGG